MARFLTVARVMVVAFWASIAVPAESAEFHLSGTNMQRLTIEGKIKPGDLARFRHFIFEKQLAQQVFISKHVFLNSPGGDVAEALAFGDFFDREFYTTIVEGHSICYSACAIMFAGGVERIMGRGGKLGFHRLVLRLPEIDVRKAQAATDPANKYVNDFLRRVGLPSLLIDKMNETPPTDMFEVDSGWLVRNELERQLAYQPAFLDVVEKKCGRDPSVVSRGALNAPPFTTETFNVWLNCANEVKSTNIDIASTKRVAEEQRIEKLELNKFIKNRKAFRWELLVGADNDHFIDRQAAIWNGRKVNMWILKNAKILGKQVSIATYAFVDCAEKSSVILQNVLCDGTMCEKPRSVYVFEGEPPQTLGSNSEFGRAAAVVCATH